MKVDIDKDGARCTYKVPAELQGWKGITHGGILSTMLDEIMVWAAAGRELETVTAEMTVRFCKPLPTEHEIRIEGEVTGIRRRLVYTRAKAYDEKKVYAEATGKLYKI